MLNTLKADPKTADMLKNAKLPNLDQSTNITQRTKELAETMFDKNAPPVIVKIQTGIQTGIENMQTGLNGISKAETDLKSAITGVSTAILKTQQGTRGMTNVIDKIQDAVKQQDTLIVQMKKLYATISSKPNTKPSASTTPTGMPASISSSSTPPAGMPTNGTMDLKTLKTKISELTNARDQLSAKVT